MQKKGLPIGNSLSPLLADIYMDDYISNNLKDINTSHDLLIITKMNEDQTKTYDDNLNKIKGTIKFTYEYENNKQLNLLDTTLTRNENDSKTDIRRYTKPIEADRLLNYKSSYPQSIKRNIIKNMTTRIMKQLQIINNKNRT